MLDLETRKMYDKYLKIRKKTQHDDDDACVISEIVGLFSKIVKRFSLNPTHQKIIFDMIKTGSSLDAIFQKASALELEQQEAYKAACRKIAEKGGGFGSYHGYSGPNNHDKSDDIER